MFCTFITIFCENESRPKFVFGKKKLEKLFVGIYFMVTPEGVRVFSE